MTKGIHKVVGICGSLRKQSTNMMALKLAGQIMQPKMKLDILPWGDVPIYNMDTQEKGFPKQVEELYEKIKNADGLLFVTPEYNHSVPGGLKNLIDWLSRFEHTPFSKKPTGIMTFAAAQSGGARAMDDLKKIMSPFNPLFLQTPEVQVNACYQKFTQMGECTDERAMVTMKAYLHDFGDMIDFAKKGHANKYLHEYDHFMEADYSL